MVTMHATGRTLALNAEPVAGSVVRIGQDGLGYVVEPEAGGIPYRPHLPDCGWKRSEARA